jgi:hypothetical protein
MNKFVVALLNPSHAEGGRDRRDDIPTLCKKDVKTGYFFDTLDDAIKYRNAMQKRWPDKIYIVIWCE